MTALLTFVGRALLVAAIIFYLAIFLAEIGFLGSR